MSRLALGFVAGLAAAWAALAIRRRIPPFPDLDPEWEPRRGDRRPQFDDATAGETHDAGCRYPRRPCVCAVMVPMHGGIGSP